MLVSISIEKALGQLTSSALFTEVFQHGTLSVEIYCPDKTDRQTPHDRDEIYVIARGTGTFRCNEKETPFQAGDFLFVPAFAPHQFVDFSADFSTWVFFYGPIGGEAKTTSI